MLVQIHNYKYVTLIFSEALQKSTNVMNRIVIAKIFYICKTVHEIAEREQLEYNNTSEILQIMTTKHRQVVD